MLTKGSGLDQASAIRRTYSAPQLVRYGAVRELTQAGSAGPNESASNPCPQVNMAESFQANCMAP